MMKYFVLKYIVPFLLIQSLILKVNCQMNRPNARRWHTAAFVDDKYYIFGGITETGQQLREFFYLDCSVSFDTSDLLWKNIDIPPSIDLVTVNGLFAVGGANNKTFFL